MPYKFEYTHEKLLREKDRRVKIYAIDKIKILARHKEGAAIRQIAREYPYISRRSIQYIIYPARAQKVADQYKARGQAGITYKKNRGARWAGIMREHRRYKASVMQASLS